MARIKVSGEEKDIENGLTIAQLLELENVEMPQYVSVSINEEFVPSEEISSSIVSDGDEVEFLYYMGGGAR